MTHGPEQLDQLESVARAQRATRSFTREPVDDNLVDRLLALATRSPSAGNSQPWEFIVVRDPAARQAIGALTSSRWSSGARDWSQANLGPELTADVDTGATGGVAGAPVLVIVCADTDRCPPGSVGESVWPAVQNLLLGATAAGLGSALTTLATGGRDLAALLGLPPGVEAMAVVPLGHPARPLRPGRREPPRIHHDSW